MRRQQSYVEVDEWIDGSMAILSCGKERTGEGNSGKGKIIRIVRWVDGLTHSDMNLYFTLRINMCNNILKCFIFCLILWCRAEMCLIYCMCVFYK